MSEFDIPLSASKLKRYDDCPEAFRLGYIERMPPEGSENRYIRRGNAVHEAIEDALAEMDRLDDQQYVKHRFLQAYSQNGGRNGYSLSDDDNEFVYDCLDVAARFVADRDPTILGIESEVKFRSQDLDHAFTGYIDVATDAEVWDWKTGKSEGKAEKRALQGAVYMAGYAFHTGRVPEAIRFVNLKEEKVDSYEPSDEMWDRVLEHGHRLLKAIDNDYYPAKPDDSRCYWCDYEVHCHASPVGAGGIDYEHYP